MATLTINGQKVKVDDSFLKLSPADRERTVNEIATKLGGNQGQAAGAVTLDRLAAGIKAADAAGNAEDVRTLGAAYRAMQAQQQGAGEQITVNLPDGSRALFPAGTSKEVMQQAIQKKFPPTGDGPWTKYQDEGQQPAGGKLPIFTIQAPDGRKLKIEAADEATAIKGAQQWVAANPAGSPRFDGIPVGGGPRFDGIPIDTAGSGEPGSTDGLSLEQRQALAKAAARKRQLESQGGLPPGGPWTAVPPEGLVPGSREYADWAASAARAGLKLPQVSQRPPEWQDPNTDLGAKAAAMGAAWINDIPVVGGPLLNGMENLKAGMYGVPVDQVKADTQRLFDANPVEAKAAGMTSTIANLLPLGATELGSLALGMKGPLALRAAMGTVSGGTLSGVDTLARGGSPEDAWHNAGVGAAVGGITPLAVAGLGKVISPIKGDPVRAAAANTLKSEGVDLTAGQATGSRGLLAREAELGGNAARNFTDRQAEQFTAAALRRVGVDAKRATADVLDKAYTDIGARFDDLSARNTLQPDQRLARDLGMIWRDYSGTTPAASRAPVVGKTLNDIATTVNSGGTVSGKAYQSTARQLRQVHPNRDASAIGPEPARLCGWRG